MQALASAPEMLAASQSQLSQNEDSPEAFAASERKGTLCLKGSKGHRPSPKKAGLVTGHSVYPSAGDIEGTDQLRRHLICTKTI